MSASNSSPSVSETGPSVKLLPTDLQKISQKLTTSKTSLIRSIKKTQTQLTQTLIRRLRFFRGKLDTVSPGHTEVPAEVMDIRLKDISKFEADLEMVKNVELKSVNDVMLREFCAKVREIGDGIEDIVGEVFGEQDETEMAELPEKLVAKFRNAAMVKAVIDDAILDLRTLLKLDAPSTTLAVDQKKKTVPAIKRATEEDILDHGLSIPKKVKSTPQATENAFLTLNDDYVSLSDSDHSDYDEEKQESQDPSKKNRPGQRQRREIWERMYGRSAKHVVEGGEGKLSVRGDRAGDSKPSKDKRIAREKETREPIIRDDVKRGRGRGLEKNRNSQIHGNGQNRREPEVKDGYVKPPMNEYEVRRKAKNNATDFSGKNSFFVAEKVKSVEKKEQLHPSWEAKKSQAITAFKGTKVTFD